MTELAIGWIRGIWGREVLRRKVDQLEARYERARRVMDGLVETNRVQGARLVATEAENQRLTAIVAAWEDANRFIDPNAKCPLCGATDGFLDHLIKQDAITGAVTQVVVRNNCNRCKAPFISGPPVAGELAKQLYQPNLQRSMLPERILEGK
jgi:hypothetical protein